MSAAPTVITIRGLTLAGERVHLELTKMKIEVRSTPAARGHARAQQQRAQETSRRDQP